ncbi:MAG: hypothetical protein ABJP66_01220 [Hyphomicrobiales bacterium]|uniref:hypothetical protein n=1 Tax=Shimia thalassica TaxID=1715693 RepID=UPI0032979AC3
MNELNLNEKRVLLQKTKLGLGANPNFGPKGIGSSFDVIEDLVFYDFIVKPYWITVVSAKDFLDLQGGDERWMFKDVWHKPEVSSHAYIHDALKERRKIQTLPHVLVFDYETKIEGQFTFSYRPEPLVAVEFEELEDKSPDCDLVEFIPAYRQYYEKIKGERKGVDPYNDLPERFSVFSAQLQKLIPEDFFWPKKPFILQFRLVDDNRVRCTSNVDLFSLSRCIRIPPGFSSAPVVYLANVIAHAVTLESLNHSMSWFLGWDSQSDEEHFYYNEITHPRAPEAQKAGLVALKDFSIGSSRALRQAVEAELISPSEAVSIVDHADNIRGWFRGQSIDGIDFGSFADEMQSIPAWSRTPAKLVRWSSLTAIGVGMDFAGTGGIGTATAVGLSAFDAFYLDKLAKRKRHPKTLLRELRSLSKK